jgi:hypothetical protein
MSIPDDPDLPVLAPAARPLDGDWSASLSARRAPGLPAVLPAVQAAAVAAGGFVAGAAVVRLAHRRRTRALARAKGHRRLLGLTRARGRGRDARAASVLEIVGSRSLLVDVHLLGGRD